MTIHGVTAARIVIGAAKINEDSRYMPADANTNPADSKSLLDADLTIK